MKISKLVYGIVLIICLTIIIAAIASLVLPEKTNAGSWRDVCCGSWCPGGDHCLGSGTYSCCKEAPAPNS